MAQPPDDTPQLFLTDPIPKSVMIFCERPTGDLDAEIRDYWLSSKNARAVFDALGLEQFPIERYGYLPLWRWRRGLMRAYNRDLTPFTRQPVGAVPGLTLEDLAVRLHNLTELVNEAEAAGYKFLHWC